MIKEAIISGCGNYRYSLTRIWDSTKPMIMFILLNPSTADHENDDPTILKCIAYSKSCGYGGFYVCNLFSYRSTKADKLLQVINQHGVNNLKYIIDFSDRVDKVVCGWGKDGLVRKLFNGAKTLDYLSELNHKLYYLRLNKPGEPSHPLYL